MIEVNDLTLTYPSGKGVFDLSFSVPEGEVTGYLGPNGAGKTTTIRALMGFMRPNKGTCRIGGRDCMRDAPEIQKNMGYIPGEIAFLDGMSGDEFLRFMNRMRGYSDLSAQKRLLQRFELDPKGKIKKFSKGMKQKLGIVTAFMHDPDVLILDEPTSGLDPLMQNRFIELIMEEKKKGKTILMSSHMFEEVERTCKNVLIIKDGRIVKQDDVQSLKNAQRKGFTLKARDTAGAQQALEAEGFQVGRGAGETLEIFVPGDQIDRFIKTAARFTLVNFSARPQSLEDVFMQYYGGEGKR